MQTDAIKLFFYPHRRYLVFGASTDPQKFGNKVLKWYKDRHLPVIPINPNAKTNIYDLPPKSSINEGLRDSNAKFCISFVTPPAVSAKGLEDLKDSKSQVKSLWFQPGSYDDSVISLAKRLGFSDAKQNLIYHGNCVMMLGDEGLKLAST